MYMEVYNIGCLFFFLDERIWLLSNLVFLLLIEILCREKKMKSIREAKNVMKHSQSEKNLN